MPEILESQSNKEKHLGIFYCKDSSYFGKVDNLIKRMGLDINENIPEGGSRLSLDSDSNEDLQLRSNNSFLHDNVD